VTHIDKKLGFRPARGDRVFVARSDSRFALRKLSIKSVRSLSSRSVRIDPIWIMQACQTISTT
jgi:hypothetical protein